MSALSFVRFFQVVLFPGLLFLSGNLSAGQTPALRQADALYRQADTLFREQKDSLALVKYQQAKTLYITHQAIGPNLVDACLGMGIIYQIQEKFDQAIGAYKESVRYQQTFKSPDDSLFIYPFILIADCYISLNQYDSAYAYYGRVEPLLARHPKNPHAFRFHNSMGFLFYSFGNYAQSINYFEKALKTVNFDSRASGHPDYQQKMTRHVMYNANIAGSLSKLGLYHQAIAKTKALIRYGRIPYTLYQSIASAYLQMEKPDSARFYLNKIPIHDISASNTINPNKARVEYYQSLGLVALQKKQSAKALSFYEQARQVSLQYFPAKNERLAAIYAGKGQAYAWQHIYGQALRNYQAAIQALHFDFQASDIYRNPTDLTNTASPLLLFKVLGYKAQAFGHYYQRTREIKDLEASLRTYQLAFRLSDHIRKGYDSDEAKLFFANTVSPVYEDAIATAFQLYGQTHQPRYLEAAFALAEQSKAAVLAESLRALEIRRIPGIAAPLLREEKDLKRNIAALNQRLADENDPARKEKYRDNLRENEIKLARTLKEFEKNEQYYQLKYDTRPVTVAQIRQELNKKTALLEYFVGTRSLFVFVITPDQFQARQLRLGPAFKRDWQVLRQALYQQQPQVRYRGNEAAHRLYRQLIAPVASALAGKDRLIIIQDKELCYLPFEALVSEPRAPRYLLHDYTVSYAYSGKLLRPAGGKSRLGRPASILAMAPFATSNRGDTQSRQPTSSADRLPPLVASAGEVKQIGGQIYLGAGATKARLLQQAGHYDIVHLATHAKANMAQPLHSFIAFYPVADGQSGYRLYVPEIYNLRLDKLKLVVLSACETGGGQLVKGEGLMSLARAFAYAGCPSTVTTLWKAEDQTTAYISTRLYAYLKAGKPKDVALRLAKLDYLESQTNWRKRSPVYWANFIFIGDQAPVYTNYAFLWWTLAALIAAGAAWWMYKKRGRQRLRRQKESNPFLVK
jgi:CHAT domain-containing protein/tetratricopeptide (TPR) repeat protein